MNKLWYEQPSKTWTHSLPLGNGHIGAMLDGGVYISNFALNEDTLWSGYPRDLHIVHSSDHYESAKNYTLNGNYVEANEIIEKNLLGSWTQAYLPLGNLSIEFEHTSPNVRDYCRSLDLNCAIHTTSFIIDDIKICTEAFISKPNDALYIKISSNKNNSLSTKISLSSPLLYTTTHNHNTLILNGIAPSHVEPSYVDCTPDDAIIYSNDDDKKGMEFGTSVSVSCNDGDIISSNDTINVKNATNIILVLTAKTSFNTSFNQPFLNGIDYKNIIENTLNLATSISFDDAKLNHINDYTSLFNRLSLELPKTNAELLPTDVRLKNFLNDKSDTGLANLLFDYGRYLLIASSRAGTQATTLQGIWNSEIRAPWSSNYTVNINTEMNYWSVEICNLSELHEPLFDLINGIHIKGQKTAQNYYSAPGFVCHHNTDIWRHTTPVGNHHKDSAVYGFWNLGSGWLSRHLYDHYLYTLDKSFLKKVLPILRDVVYFYNSLLVKNDDGHYFLPMSTSPENYFEHNNKTLSICETTTMTTAIVKETFSNYIQSLSALGIEDSQKNSLINKLNNFLPYKIHNSILLEWYHNFKEIDTNHRHISHLYPLFPGDEFSFEHTPDLMEASKNVLKVRGDDGTGWSLSWKVNLFAKLRDGNHALKLIERQLHLVDTTSTIMSAGGGTYTNLFDAHPPFQIDGNFGVTAGICNMLVESRIGVVYLLKALPNKWHTGKAYGIKLKGNITINIEWKNMHITKAVFISPTSQSLDIYYNDTFSSILLNKNTSYSLI